MADLYAEIPESPTVLGRAVADAVNRMGATSQFRGGKRYRKCDHCGSKYDTVAEWAFNNIELVRVCVENAKEAK
jgi:hypothetical protein